MKTNKLLLLVSVFSILYFLASNLLAQTIGWAQKESMPTQVARKYVRDGGSLTSVDDEIFAFRGYRSSEFYKYAIGAGYWTQLESIPYGWNPGASPPTINRKKVDQGGALCFDGVNIIYATKGGGTKEFWAYDITQNSWWQKSFVPSERGLRGGTSLAYFNGKIYLLAGEQSEYAPTNFFVYNPPGDTVGGTPWSPLTPVPLIPDDKTFRDGSCICHLGDIIYVLKGRGAHNYFWAYDIVSNTWTQKETIPLVHPLNQTGDDFKDEEVSVWDGPTDRIRKTKVKEGGAMTTDGSVIYAIKGGGSHEFWQYEYRYNEWQWVPLDTIPRLNRQSVPKHGAALAYAGGKVYLLKGNNTPEFWQYIPTTEKSKVKSQMSKAITNTQEELTLKQVQGDRLLDLTPNPFTKLTTIHYTVPVSGKVSVKLYNTTGRLIETLVNDNLIAGTYTVNFSSKNFANGVYFLRYSDNTNQKEIKLIVE